MSYPVFQHGLVKTHSHNESNLGTSHFPRKANSGSREALMGFSFLYQITPWVSKGITDYKPKGRPFLSWKNNK